MGVGDEAKKKRKKKQYRYLGRIIKARASQCLASVVSVEIVSIPANSAAATANKS